MPTLAIGSPPEPDNRDEHPTVPGAYEREAGTGPSALEADTGQLKPALAAIEAAVEDVGCRHPEPLVGSYADGFLAGGVPTPASTPTACQVFPPSLERNSA